MNRPCRIHFHGDSFPDMLPDRYQPNIENRSRHGMAIYALLVQSAFVLDFAPTLLRTRVGGGTEDPVDFPLDSISHIEWFYNDKVPYPLIAQPHVSRTSRQGED